MTVLWFPIREVLVYPLFYLNTRHPCLPPWQPFLALLFSPFQRGERSFPLGPPELTASPGRRVDTVPEPSWFITAPRGSCYTLFLLSVGFGCRKRDKSWAVYSKPSPTFAAQGLTMPWLHSAMPQDIRDIICLAKSGDVNFTALYYAGKRGKISGHISLLCKTPSNPNAEDRWRVVMPSWAWLCFRPGDARGEGSSSLRIRWKCS